MTAAMPAGVSVQVTARPEPGREADYERVVTGMLATAAGFPGHQDTQVRRTDGQYEIVVAFDTPEHYRVWETSPERHTWARQLPDLIADSSEQRRLRGLDLWLVDPAAPYAPPPPRWKTAVVTWLGIFPTVVVLVIPIGLLIPPAAFLLWGNLVVTLLCTLAMTYAVMPALTRLLAGWLRG